MSIEIKIPPLPESVADAVIVQWHKQAGEAVKQDENLLDIETDKVVLEVPAPADGVLSQVLENEGAVVSAGQVVATLAEGVADTATTAAQATATPQAEPASGPAARKLMAEHQLTANDVSGSGKGGRILKQDVQAVVQQQTPPQPQNAEAVATLTNLEPPTLDDSGAETRRGEQRVAMSRIRARIAERLLDAQHSAAMLTTFNEVNMQPVMDLRKRYKEAFEKQHGVRLGFMSFFIKASAEALKHFPEVNASIDGNDVLYHDYVDIGVAVSTERGLVVPIVRDADQQGFADLEAAIVDFAQRGRDGKLSMEELSGGTFSITNGGVFGSLLSTPILNPPQSAILGMHKIEQRPIVEDGAIVARPMMYLALTYDHRLVDGSSAVQFLVKIKDYLEDPARLLLAV